MGKEVSRRMQRGPNTPGIVGTTRGMGVTGGNMDIVSVQQLRQESFVSLDPAPGFHPPSSQWKCSHLWGTDVHQRVNHDDTCYVSLEETVGAGEMWV